MKCLNKILTVLMIFVSFGTAEASVAINAKNFPDEAFRLYVTLNFDSDFNGTLSDSEIKSITKLDIQSLKITSVKGIENFTSLTELYCQNNTITELKINKLTALTKLDCSNNQITELNVSKNTALTYLHCQTNRLTQLDLSKNRIEDLAYNDQSPQELKCSEDAGLHYVKLKDYLSDNLNKISGVVGQVDGWGWYNVTTTYNDSSGVALFPDGMPKRVYYAYDTCNKGTPDSYKMNVYFYTSYSASEAKTEQSGSDGINAKNFPDEAFRLYVSLNFDSNSDGKLSDSEIKSVTKIKVNSLKITSLKGIEKFTDLTELYCQNNALTELNINKLTALTKLDCSDNLITALNVSKNTALTYLHCQTNRLTQLDLSKNRIEDLNYNDQSPQELKCREAAGLHYVNLKNYLSDNLNKISGVVGQVDGWGWYNVTTTYNDSSGVALFPDGMPKRVYYAYDTCNKGTPDSYKMNVYFYTVYATADDPDPSPDPDDGDDDGDDSNDPEPSVFDIDLDFDDEGDTSSYYEGTATVSGGTAPYEWDYEGNIPTGLELTQNKKGTKATIKGTPTETGEFTFILTVKDSKGSEDDATITITINDSPIETLEFESEFAPIWQAKRYYSGTAKATGGVAPYKWEVEGELPPGLSLSEPDDDDDEWQEAEIEGKPVKAGVYSFNLVLTDSKGISTEKTIEITITTPKIKGSLTKTGLIKQSYNSSLNVEGGIAPYKWKVSSGTLPAGIKLSYNKDTGKATVKGKPTEAGNFVFKLKVYDANSATASKQYTLTITAPEITGTFKTGQVKKTYSGSAKVAGGKAPYTWKCSGKPTGLTFSQNAKGTKVTLKGTPTKAKTFTMKLTVTDANKAKTVKEFTIKIKKAATSNSKLTNINESLSAIQTEFNNVDLNFTTSLEVFDEDILSKGEGRDEDLITVKLNQPLRVIIGEWPVEVLKNEIKVLIDDEVKNEIEVSDENTFTIPKEFVNGDFKIQVKAGEFESSELYISVE